jgi:protein gp37
VDGKGEIMGAYSGIAWCDHTFNPWVGCTKVSEGCKFCYAEHDTFPRVLRAEGIETWGRLGKRVRTSAAYWKKPLSWNKKMWLECGKCGWRGEEEDGMRCPACGFTDCEPTRQRVFCASLADVADHHPSIKNEWVEDLVRLIVTCSDLDFLLLTKRPLDFTARFGMFWGNRYWPKNVWVGTTVENQKEADKRIPLLLKVPAKVHFLSVEPMLEPVSILGAGLIKTVDWVICGGESGPHARPMNVAWARLLRDECRDTKTAFFMKQLGGFPNKRHEMEDFPEDLRIREFPR